MKEQLHIVLITVGIFVAGLIAGIWTQRTRPIPAPPTQVLGEFRTVAPPGATLNRFPPGAGPIRFGIERFSSRHPAAMVTMRRNIAALEPKIKKFQSAINSIENNFRGKLDKVLNPVQRKELVSIEAKQAPQTFGYAVFPQPKILIRRQGMPDFPYGPGGNGPHFFVTTRAPFPLGGWLLMSMVIYQPSLEHLTGELKLNPAQKAEVKNLMVDRRTKLLALIDRTPPPTLGFSSPLP